MSGVARIRVMVTIAVLVLGAPATTGCGGTGGDSHDSSPSASPTPRASETSTPSPSGRYVFPIRHNRPGYGRWHAVSPATDVFAPCGSPVVAVTDGVVLELSRVDNFAARPKDGAAKGGLFVSIAGDDGVRYYGSHLSTVAPHLSPGTRVAAGEQLGTVGRTGNASNICHLHFAISPICRKAGDWWIRRGVVYPWPYLDAWRKGELRSPAPAVTAWQQRNGCAAAPPRTG